MHYKLKVAPISKKNTRVKITSVKIEFKLQKMLPTIVGLNILALDVSKPN
jgi:hypothetical protein